MAPDDGERLLESSHRKPMPGTKWRRRTSVTQSIMAVFVLAFGVALIVMQYGDSVPPFGYRVRSINTGKVFDNAGSGAWASLVFLLTALVGYNSGKSKNMVSLYLALCLASILASSAVISTAAASIAMTAPAQQTSEEVCGYRLYRYCEEHESMPSYRWHSYQFTPTEFDCERYSSCKKEILRMFRILTPLRVLLMLCGLVELICAMVGLSFTCNALCSCRECCMSTETDEYRQVNFCHMDADGRIIPFAGQPPANAPFPTFLPVTRAGGRHV